MYILRQTLRDTLLGIIWIWNSIDCAIIGQAEDKLPPPIERIQKGDDLSPFFF